MKSAAAESARTSKRVWAGRFASGLVIFLLLLDASGKLARLPPVVEGTAQLGFPAGSVLQIGVVELLCVVAYLVPGTSVAGAVLLTGYLGGAVATHLRMESPLWTHVLSPVYVGLFVWGGLLLRDPALRAFLPVRRQPLGTRAAAFTGSATAVSRAAAGSRDTATPA
jgi:hypothetical protein